MGKKQLKLGLIVKEFSYAYGGLHRWSPRGEKAAKVGFDSQKTKEEEERQKKEKTVKHNKI